MVKMEPMNPADRARWLLGRYPDVTPEEVREVTAFLKHSPALDIALLETSEEVKPVLVRFRQDRKRDFDTPPSLWLVMFVLGAIGLLAGYALWDFGAAE